MINPSRRAAELARQEATEAEVKASRLGVTSDDLARAAEVARLAKLAEASRDVLEDRERAAEADRREQAHDQAVTAHAAAVELEAGRIAAAEKAVADSRKTLVKEAKAADAQAARLYAAGEAHDALVAQLAAEFRMAGLSARYSDADEAVEFEVGGAADGLLLPSGWWVRVDPQALIWRTLYGVLCARVGAEFPESRQIRYGRGVDKLERQTAGLLDGCPLPEPHRPDRSWLATLAERHAVLVADQEAAHVVSDSRREDHERDLAREERQNKETEGRVQRRLKQIERTGEPMFS